MRFSKSFILRGFAFVLGIWLTACTKDSSPGVFRSEPVFGLNMQIDGQNLRASAGEEGYYMHTKRYNDTNGVRIWEGLLAVDSLNPKNAIALRFRAFPNGVPTAHVDSLLKPGAHSSYHQSGSKSIPYLHKVNLAMINPANVQSILWNLGNGSFSSAQSPEVIYNENNQAQYPIKMSSLRSGGCETEITHYLDFSQNGCKATFNISQNQPFQLNAQSYVRSGTLQQVNWRLNGIPQVSGLNGILYGVGAGKQEICAEFVFNDGCIYISCREIELDQSGLLPINHCNDDFDYTISPYLVYDVQQFGKGELIYFDENGKAFSSYYANANQNIVVLEVEAYLNDWVNEPTRKLKVVYTGQLGSADGQFIQVENLEAILALGVDE